MRSAVMANADKSRDRSHHSALTKHAILLLPNTNIRSIILTRVDRAERCTVENMIPVLLLLCDSARQDASGVFARWMEVWR